MSDYWMDHNPNTENLSAAADQGRLFVSPPKARVIAETASVRVYARKDWNRNGWTIPDLDTNWA